MSLNTNRITKFGPANEKKVKKIHFECFVGSWVQSLKWQWSKKLVLT